MTGTQAQGHFGVVPLETLTSMSGLDFLIAVKDGRLPAPPMAGLLGFRLESVAAGHITFVGEPGPQHYNPIGSVHAGFAATMLDSCMACAVHSTLEIGWTYTTLEFKINLVRALVDTVGPVRAEGRIVHSGRRTATAEGKLTDRDGRLYAHATTTCIVLNAAA